MIMYSASSAAGGAPSHSPAPGPFPAAHRVPTGGRPVPPPADPRSHGGLCSRERRSATDFFLARAAALRLSRSRMSRKDRRSDSSLSRSAGDRDVPSHPARGGCGQGCPSPACHTGQGWQGLSDAEQTEAGVTCPVPPAVPPLPAPAPAPHNPAIDGPGVPGEDEEGGRGPALLKAPLCVLTERVCSRLGEGSSGWGLRRAAQRAAPPCCRGGGGGMARGSS